MRTDRLRADELNLIKPPEEYSDEDKAIALLESLRGPGGVSCPHCKSKNEAYRLRPKPESKSPGRKGLYCCGVCRRQFTVRVGTVFEDSHLPISKWLVAVSILCSSKKSVSARQLHRMLGITYKSAWLMARRIRSAMGLDNAMAPRLGATTEADEPLMSCMGNRETKQLKKSPHNRPLDLSGARFEDVVRSLLSTPPVPSPLKTGRKPSE